MAASRSSRVTRSSVGLNGLDENFCGRTLRNRSIAQPEETSPPPRARSPKKKQDNQQHQQAGTNSGKVADGKPEGEPATGHRKRGLSVSEKEEPERSEGSERGRAGGGQETSPVLKRAKRCSRSGESQGTEEEHSPKSESPEPAAAKENDEDSKLDTSSASPSLGLEKDPEEKKDKSESLEESTSPSQADESHKATNGLAELHKELLKEDLEPAALPEEPCASPTTQTLTNSPSLPNGSQAAPSTPDPIVPCKSPLIQQVDESDGPQLDGERNCSAEEAAEAVLSLDPEVEVEVDVDVVGDSIQAQDERTVEENANGCTPVEPQDPSDDCSNISGETTGLASFRLPAEPPSFTEPQEHRYTLRTPPLDGCAQSSSPKPDSSHTDNGLPKEEEEVEEEEVEATTVPLNSDEACHKEPPVDGPSLTVEADSEVSEQVEAKASEEAAVLDGRMSRSTKEPSVSLTEDEEEDPDVYYFESDHLALKHNKDYQRLLQTIGVLEAQRTQAILDLETLAFHQKQALTDPISFVDQLQKRVELGLPCPQRVVQLPEIAWDQYTSGRSEFEREFCDKKRKTRRLKLIFDKVGLPARPKSPVDSKKESDSSTLYSSLPSSDAPEHSMASNRTQMIRGRPYHQSKPDTFNQLWTVEEQKKLEQLLLKFPPEEVESKRWQKIADELGNRTAKQVASRVQKYFIKLTKAGIPVPGRTPNLCMYSKKASGKRHHHLNKHLYRPSTFLTSYEPPVYMDDEDDRPGFFSSLQDNAADDSDEDSVPVELRHLPEYKELQELKRLRKQKIQEIHSESALAQHMGYKCDACGMEPIQGVRWHCQDCPQDNAVDFCGNCSDCLFKTETHKPSHRLEPVYQAETFLDRDYCLPPSAGYNYLDPNYFPANR
ncbi:ZZ-type zinc finger-containing protein 3 [Astyanax mexicanus]|uniref:ZZ-type zinc finger-containing protein 3 n=1 Tax=Astyanax mexicanus TaxID=7994 RepID=A0A8B9J7B0_ASTMX|nr:ZZ-type zinc finger-containing protein 3 [Astyanax mexicanus]XP_049339110.1 ZZ-type zinc finger-containing protein 3 [Astyanax mexicanus]KAG9273718.1 ZZ-type zinc finger-containing protein 3 [Astyanax mexicanus]